MKHTAACFLGAWLSLSCLAAPADRLLDGIGFDQRVGAQLPLDTPLIDETGSPVALHRFVGPQPALLLFTYYRCTNLCGAMITELAARLRDLDLRSGRDFQVVVVSIDPTDTAIEAHAAKLRYGSTVDGWHFFTASAAPLAELTHAAGFRYKRDGDHAFIHPAGAVVVTPEGRISSYLFAFDPGDPALRYALIAASGDRLGRPIDRLWLLCHRFDPASGRYSSLVATLERGVGLASVGSLAALIGWLARRRRIGR